MDNFRLTRYIHTLLGRFSNFNFGGKTQGELFTILANRSLVDRNGANIETRSVVRISELEAGGNLKNLGNCDHEDLELCYNKICRLIRKLEISIDETGLGEHMLESGH